MAAELIPFPRAVVAPEAQAAAHRSLASGWLTTSPESFAHLTNHPDAGVPNVLPQAPAVRAQVASAYADDY